MLVHSGSCPYFRPADGCDDVQNPVSPCPGSQEEYNIEIQSSPVIQPQPSHLTTPQGGTEERHGAITTVSAWEQHVTAGTSTQQESSSGAVPPGPEKISTHRQCDEDMEEPQATLQSDSTPHEVPTNDSQSQEIVVESPASPDVPSDGLEDGRISRTASHPSSLPPIVSQQEQSPTLSDYSQPYTNENQQTTENSQLLLTQHEQPEQRSQTSMVSLHHSSESSTEHSPHLVIDEERVEAEEGHMIEHSQFPFSKYEVSCLVQFEL